VVLAVVLAVIGVTAAQTTLPLQSQPAAGLPATVRAALEQTDDFAFSFSQPGFYALLDYLKTAERPPGFAHPPIAIEDWSVLLERPADFRGLPLTIEGRVGRNTAWRFEQPEQRHLGQVWQLELWAANQPIAATVILTQDAGDIAIGSTIRVTGYFVMIRQYYSETKRVRQAALLVAQGPTLISHTVTHAETRPTSDWILGLVITGTAALLGVWLLVRRSVGRGRSPRSTLHASGPAPQSLADDLAVWAEEEAKRSPGKNDDDEAGARR